MEEAILYRRDYCGPDKNIHKGFFIVMLKNQQKRGQEGLTSLWRSTQELLVIDH